VLPTLVRATRRTLERGRRNPRKGDGRLLRARPGRRRDVALVRRVSSVAIGPVRPFLPSRCHPGHCSTIPDAVGLQGDKTPPRRLLCALRPRVSVRTTTQREISTPPPSKPLLDGHRACHDAPSEARFARTAVHSVALSAMPSHVARTVRYACKLPPPWPIKGGAVPWPRGGRQIVLTYTLSAIATILALASIKKPLGPRGPASSPASLVAPLCKNNGATQYSAPSTPLLVVRPRLEPG
jgi:hypothetical protein